METLYRKVAVSERMPKRGGTYLSNEGEVFYSSCHKEFQHNYDPYTMYPEWWLEPIPDPTAQLKSDKEELLEALEDISRWTKIKDGKATYSTSEGRLKEIESLIQKMKQ